MVGAIHAGWRGTLNQISYKTFRYISDNYGIDYADVFVSIGPSIKGECYEIGEDVAERFFQNFSDHTEYLYSSENNKYRLDLELANIRQLESLGIKNIDALRMCTYCESSLPSYRRDGDRAGRILSFIGLV